MKNKIKLIEKENKKNSNFNYKDLDQISGGGIFDSFTSWVSDAASTVTNVASTAVKHVGAGYDGLASGNSGGSHTETIRDVIVPETVVNMGPITAGTIVNVTDNSRQ